MTTDEMIMDLVKKHGFKLPDGIKNYQWPVKFWTMQGADKFNTTMDIDPAKAHDLCAAEFARQVKNRPIGGTNRASLEKFMGFGNSSAAIKALWEALQ